MSKDANLQKVIDALNEARAGELTAIYQYMAQHYELDNDDFGKLAMGFKATGIQEMKHAEMLAERILFLGGTPVTKPDGVPMKGQSIADMLKTDIGLEKGAVKMYNHHAMLCADCGDLVSKALFEDLLKDEEAHLDAFLNLLDHIEKLGTDFLATQTGGGE